MDEAMRQRNDRNPGGTGISTSCQGEVTQSIHQLLDGCVILVIAGMEHGNGIVTSSNVVDTVIGVMMVGVIFDFSHVIDFNSASGKCSGQSIIFVTRCDQNTIESLIFSKSLDPIR